VLLLAVSIN